MRFRFAGEPKIDVNGNGKIDQSVMYPGVNYLKIETGDPQAVRIFDLFSSV